MALPVFVILFIGLTYVARLAESAQSADMTARTCAWLYSANDCTEIPPGCDGYLRSGTASSDLGKVVTKEFEDRKGDISSSGNGGSFLSGFVGALLESAVQDAFGRSLDATVSNDTHPPELFGGDKVTATVTGHYQLACNLKPTTLGNVAADAWNKLMP